MRILISNDDGIRAPGIGALVEAVAPLGEVVVVAPDRQRSATSHAISLHHRLIPAQVDFELPSVTAYSLSGTPADCVKWAICELAGEAGFDVMLSGINEGANLAADVLYSGTVAAAGEAALQGVPSAALSLAGPPWSYEQAAKRTAKLLLRIPWSQLGADNFLNINFPSRDSFLGYQVTKLGVRSYRDKFRHGQDDDGGTYYKYVGEETAHADDAGTDTHAIHQGLVSITPLCYRFTNDELLDTISRWMTDQRPSDAGTTDKLDV